jgi:exonuclease SbcC
MEKEKKVVKVSKISIKNVFGITSEEVSSFGQITALEGKNGSGKTSFIDALKFALSHKSERTDIVKGKGTEGTVYVTLSNGTEIKRIKRTEKSDYNKITGTGGTEGTEAYLRNLFSKEQFNPLKFVSMTKKEQNKILLSLVEDTTTDYDMIKWFGYVPNTKDLKSQHILSKLSYLGSIDSEWYNERHLLNKKGRYTRETADDLLKDIPDLFDPEKYKNIDLSIEYGNIEKKNSINISREKAKNVIENFENKCENIENKYEKEENDLKEYNEFNRTKFQKKIDEKVKFLEEGIYSENCMITERNKEISKLQDSIEKMKIHIESNNNEINLLKETGVKELSKELDATELEKIRNIDKMKIIELSKEATKERISKEYLENNQSQDIEKLKLDAKEKEEMKSYIPNYQKSIEYLYQVEELKNKSNNLSKKLKKARELPSILLEKAELPISGLIIEKGIVKILNSNGDYVPVDNLSEGEKLELCLDIAKAKSGELGVILVDGFEKLDEEKQELFIAKAKQSSLQYFITKVGNGELEIKEY